MSRRERGWTVAGLVVAVVLLVGSVAWALGAGAGGALAPRWQDHHRDRGASVQEGVPWAPTAAVHAPRLEP